jgi:hypothetical protein
MSNLKGVHGDPLSWLLEPDPDNPGVRYFALRDLAGLTEDHPDLILARQAVLQSGPVPVILSRQDPAGYWERPDNTYYPKYTGTVWSLMSLAQFGASGEDPRIQKACEYIFDHNFTPFGRISYNHTPSGSIHCLEGNLISALVDLGCLEDVRLMSAVDWLARSITGDGFESPGDKSNPARYYRSSNCGPNFACSANNFQPCAWGAVKAVIALAKIPELKRSPAVKAGIQAGIDFLLSCDPAVADYPTAYTGKPSRSWLQLGYPLFYVTDVLQTLEALALVGCRDDPRIQNAVQWLLSKQDGNGRWKMEYTYNGKTWIPVEEKGQPSKWVTLRALRVMAV